MFLKSNNLLFSDLQVANYSELSYNYMFLKSNLLFSDLQVATKPELLKCIYL